MLIEDEYDTGKYLSSSSYALNMNRHSLFGLWGMIIKNPRLTLISALILFICGVKFLTSGKGPHDVPQQKLPQSEAKPEHPVQPETVKSIYNLDFKYRNLSQFEPPVCSLQKNIFFLRQPKTMSSTLIHIFYRFVIKHQLKASNAALNYPDVELKPPYDFYTDAFTHYNEEITNNVMHPNPIRITSIRYPAEQLVSISHKWQLYDGLFGDNALENLQKEYSAPRDDAPYYVDNPMARTFGLSKEKVRDREAIADLVKMVDEKFSVVLIQGFMSESLVLMRRRLCWDFNDILYVSIGRTDYDHKLLPPEVQSEHEKLAPADYAIYQHFSTKLIQTIAHEPLFMQEVQMFNSLLARTKQFCDRVKVRMRQNLDAVGVIAQETGLHLDPRPFGEPFTLNGVHCIMLEAQLQVKKSLVLRLLQPELCEQEKLHYKVCEHIHPDNGLPLKMIRRVVEARLFDSF